MKKNETRSFVAFFSFHLFFLLICFFVSLVFSFQKETIEKEKKDAFCFKRKEIKRKTKRKKSHILIPSLVTQNKNMIIKLQTSRIKRLTEGKENHNETIVELEKEISLLKSCIEHHPAVIKFAVENTELRGFFLFFF